MVVAAAATEGVAPSSTLVVPFLVALAIVVFELSTLFAFAGVTHTDFDVIQIVIRRAGKEVALPALSVGASVLHLLISMAAIPITKVASPSTLFGPELRITLEGLVMGLTSASLLGIAAFLAWRHRMSWQAVPAQQREAEQFSGDVP